MASHAVRRLPDENLTDIFIPIPEVGIPEVVDRLEEDLHLKLEGVEDDDLFKDGFVDKVLEDNGEECDDDAAGTEAGGRNGQMGPDLVRAHFREFETESEFT